jgi:integrase
VDSLIAFLGHEDAQRITPKQIADWTEHLRHAEGLSARTVEQKYLVAIKRIFTVGKRKFRITDNPAADVSVDVKKAVRTRSPGFTDHEAKAILLAALRAPETPGKTAEATKLAIRWGTWLCAYTGARIGEVMQLRKQDVEVQEGIPCIRITPEAGSTKTGDQRLVPLHPHLLDMGFLDFVQSRAEGYLFFTLKPGDDPVTRAGTLGKKVGGWVRQVAGIADDRLQPNHAWRHRLKTELRRLSIEREVMDAIQGHRDGSASEGYGEQPVKPLYEAIEKLPRYEVG